MVIERYTAEKLTADEVVKSLDSLWEESTRIPLIIYGLNTAKGKECKQPVSLIDIYPTLIDICDLPQDPNQNTNNYPMDGNSLQPLLTQPETKQWNGGNFALTAIASGEEIAVNSPADLKEQHYSIRTERYRYILCRNGDEELYDHYYDPYEWYDLANDPSYFVIKKKLNKHVPYN